MSDNASVTNLTTNLTRRRFAQIALLGTQAGRLFGASGAANAIDRVLREGIQRRNIPCVTAMVASADRILYSGAFGKRDQASGIAVQPDSMRPLVCSGSGARCR